MTKKKKQQRGKKSSSSISTNMMLDLFCSLPEEAFSEPELCHALGVRGREAQRDVARALKKLCALDLISCNPYNNYKINRSQIVNSPIGKVSTTSSGTIYVMLEDGSRDILVQQRYAMRALPQDSVHVVITKKSKNGSKPEGIIVGIAARANKKYVGILEIRNNTAFVIIDNGRIPDVYISMRELKDAKDGQKVLVRLVEWAEGMNSPLGEIVDVLGNSGDNDTEMHAILAEFDLPYSYPKEVEAAADRISDVIDQQEINKRRDMRSVPTYTIDPADAKDFDDALSIQRLENGLIEVGVHIADVSHYVKQDDIIDTEAQERATSVYLVDRTIPMLPERLCNGLCSLRPNEDKLSFSAIFEMTDDAKIVKEWFGRTVMHSNKRFTYEQAQQIIETKEGEFKDDILELNRLARILRRNRFKNGSISFERSEPKFILDDSGKPEGVYFKISQEAHQLIEEFMLQANRSVAEFIGRKKGNAKEKTFIYRVHDAPNPDKLSEFRSFITRFGYNLKQTEGRALAQGLNSILKDIHGKAEENLISTLAIRSMSKATYTTNNIGHYGLAFDHYTHFTSPIRRYPDTMVHRLLAHYLEGGSSVNQEYYENQCEHSSDMEARVIP
ncbi:MAG: VacB/RNase II family 3'-5' exoribonuclease, partial [Rikenellaceae bacterium]